MIHPYIQTSITLQNFRLHLNGTSAALILQVHTIRVGTVIKGS